MTRFSTLVLAFVALSCGQAVVDDIGNDSNDDASVPANVTCTPCTQSTDCQGGACVQYAGSDYCGSLCDGDTDCASGETCMASSTEDGVAISVCMPSNGTCGQNGCGSCDAGTSCDLVSGECVEPEQDAGGDDGGDDLDAGEPDAGSDPDGGTVAPYVGPDGGKVNRLYFAVIGDTRPPASNDTAHYPTAIINKIYADIQEMSPRPQFVVTTGDYMFASPSGTQGLKQMKLYVAARKQFKGPLFAALGNHECGGGNANCAGATANNNSFNAFLDQLMKPLGQTKAYYSVRIDDLDGEWTSKFVIVACNAWSTTQKNWLTKELAKKTTYTFIARHQPKGSAAPCTDAMAPILQSAKYDMFLTGHVHKYLHSGKQLVEGVGGAPLTGTTNYGYATVHQLASGGLKIRQYDYKTKKVVGSYTLP